jgi:hypothetical protein
LLSLKDVAVRISSEDTDIISCLLNDVHDICCNVMTYYQPFNITAHLLIALCFLQQRMPVPDEKKDHKYWDRRRKNNQAAKRSRDTRKKRIDDEIKTAKEAITENQKLKQEIDVSNWCSRSYTLENSNIV